VEVERRGDQVRISICDNGKGIPADVMPHIFDPFFTTHELGEGAGLGLTIAHSLIANHGGKISVKSVPGQTVFTVSLPLHLVAEPQPIETIPACPPPEPLKPKLGRVLVVDDEEGIVGAVSDFLEMNDIATDQACDGERAMRWIRENRYDAIISDIRMPNMDGKQLFYEATQFEPGYQGRFVFMSGDLVRDATQAFVRTMTCPVMAKPFSLQQMHNLIVPHLNNFSGIRR
jgi:two-component system NtrC family sensor kinase